MEQSSAEPGDQFDGERQRHQQTGVGPGPVPERVPGAAAQGVAQPLATQLGGAHLPDVMDARLVEVVREGTLSAGTQGEVRFLEVEEVVRVEASQFLEESPAHQEEGADDLVDRTGGGGPSGQMVRWEECGDQPVEAGHLAEEDAQTGEPGAGDRR